MSLENARRNQIFATQRRSLARIIASEEKLNDLDTLVCRCDYARELKNKQQNARLGLIEFKVNILLLCVFVVSCTNIVVHGLPILYLFLS